MKINRLIFCGFIGFACLFFFTSCKEIEVENGEIPDEYLGAASEYMGLYEGRFDGFRGELRLQLQGNRLEFLYKSEFGSDLIDPRCQSEVGDLLSFKLKSGDKEKIETAKLEFFPGFCADRIQGEVLNFRFDHKGEGDIDLHLYILEEVRYIKDCHRERDPSGGYREVCRTEARPVYLTGKFEKQ